MDVFLNQMLGTDYSSNTQKIRVMSEDWLAREAFCPNCCATHISKHPNNMPAADLYCQHCNENFELKSVKGSIGKKIPDGSFNAMLDRMNSDQNANLFVLNYSPNKLNVVNLFVVPKYYFVPSIIQQRKPLSITARRAGWVGCNILLEQIPEAGRIFIIKNGVERSRNEICHEWEKTQFINEIQGTQPRGWLLDVMRCIDKLESTEFRLEHLYQFEAHLSQLHPNNRNIKPKIRQQLQILRDAGYLDFIKRGNYRLTQ